MNFCKYKGILTLMLFFGILFLNSSTSFASSSEQYFSSTDEYNAFLATDYVGDEVVENMYGQDLSVVYGEYWIDTDAFYDYWFDIYYANIAEKFKYDGEYDAFISTVSTSTLKSFISSDIDSIFSNGFTTSELSSLYNTYNSRHSASVLAWQSSSQASYYNSLVPTESDVPTFYSSLDEFETRASAYTYNSLINDDLTGYGALVYANNYSSVSEYTQFMEWIISDDGIAYHFDTYQDIASECFGSYDAFEYFLNGADESSFYYSMVSKSASSLSSDFSNSELVDSFTTNVDSFATTFLVSDDYQTYLDELESQENDDTVVDSELTIQISESTISGVLDEILNLLPIIIPVIIGFIGIRKGLEFIKQTLLGA